VTTGTEKQPKGQNQKIQPNKLNIEENEHPEEEALPSPKNTGKSKTKSEIPLEPVPVWPQKPVAQQQPPPLKAKGKKQQQQQHSPPQQLQKSETTPTKPDTKKLTSVETATNSQKSLKISPELSKKIVNEPPLKNVDTQKKKDQRGESYEKEVPTKGREPQMEKVEEGMGKMDILVKGTRACPKENIIRPKSEEFKLTENSELKSSSVEEKSSEENIPGDGNSNLRIG